MSDLIDRVRKALECPYKETQGLPFFQGVKSEHARTAKLVEALVDAVDSMNEPGVAYCDAAMDNLESALKEMESK